MDASFIVTPSALQWNWSLAGTHELDDVAGTCPFTTGSVGGQPGGIRLPLMKEFLRLPP